MQSFFCVLIFIFAQNTPKGNQTLKALLLTIRPTHHEQLKFNLFLSRPPSHSEKIEGLGEKIVVGMVVKSKIGELEEEVRAGSPRRTRKDLTGVMKGVLGKRRFLVRFKNICKKNLSLNQLTIVIVENIPEEKEPNIFMNYEIPKDKVTLEQG